MLIFSGVFRSPIVITSTVTIVPYFSNDTKGSFDETFVRTHVVDSGIGGLWRG